MIARELAERGHSIDILEQRSHIGGNCHTERDLATGVMLPRQGLHIFRTDDDEVWSHVNKYMEFKPFVKRVKATTQGKGILLAHQAAPYQPVLRQDILLREAQLFIDQQADISIETPQRFEDQALRFVDQQMQRAKNEKQLMFVGRLGSCQSLAQFLESSCHS